MSQSKFIQNYNRVQKAWSNLLGAIVDFIFSFFPSEVRLVAIPEEAPLRQAFRKAVAELISLGSASVNLDLEKGRLACNILGPVLYVPNPDPHNENQLYLAIAPDVVGFCYFTGTDFVLAGQNPNVLPIDLVTDLLEAIHLYIEQYYESLS